MPPLLDLLIVIFCLEHITIVYLISGRWAICSLCPRFKVNLVLLRTAAMAMTKQLLLLLLVITLVSTFQKPKAVEARLISSLPRQKSSSFFSTLGLVCKCCDGEKGKCTSTWTRSCSKLQCSPWKLPKKA